MDKKQKEAIRRQSRGQAGLERKAYFSKPGSTAADWRGGRKQMTKDRKKEASRNACRKRLSFFALR